MSYFKMESELIPEQANHESVERDTLDPVKVAATGLQFKLPSKVGDYG